ncbi:MAG: N-acetylmuramoyl-L-alanine amidase [Phycisphaerae bacterium]
MARQAPESATALLNRLSPFLDAAPKARVEASAATWPNGIGADISDVRCVMIHGTAGWPTHDKADEFVNFCINGASAKPGISPHFYIALDGRVFHIFPENRLVWHGVQMSYTTIGVETGNLMATGAPPTAPHPPAHWDQAVYGPTNWIQMTAQAEDIPGAKLFACHPNNQVIVCYWSTARPATPDAAAEGDRMMLYSEAQYRSWRLLARYFAEVWRIPRNLPLRPQLRREAVWPRAHSETYRKLVNADASKELLLPQLAAAPINCTTFDTDAEAAFAGRYAAQIYTESWTENGHPKSHRANWFWRNMFKTYRGFVSHGYPGSVNLDDHNCPGALFDFNRFARELWDFWWFPFDLQAGPNPGDPVQLVSARRDYGRTQPEVLEYYWDSVPARFLTRTGSGYFGVGDEILPMAPVVLDPAHFSGYWHGGMHFALAADTPIYAAAGGQIVAARFPVTYPAGQDRDAAASHLGSTRFVLLRHEVWHRQAAGGNRINYNDEPSYVYSLYMHLGAPTGMSFENVVAANPDWLNRVIARKKEYDAGLAFQPLHPNPAALWVPWTTRWQAERTIFDPLLTQLAAGNTVVFPEGDRAIPVSLGDFLGNAGHLAPNQFAIHFEVLADRNLDPAFFQGRAVSPAGPFYDRAVEDQVTQVVNAEGGVQWLRALRTGNPALAAAIFSHAPLQFKSEWSLTAADFPSGGWSTYQPYMWWQDVVPVMNGNAGLPAGAALPANANVWHYHPQGFMSWLNGVTWASELSKYRLPSPSQVDARPPRRR